MMDVWMVGLVAISSLLMAGLIVWADKEIEKRGGQ